MHCVISLLRNIFRSRLLKRSLLQQRGASRSRVRIATLHFQSRSSWRILYPLYNPLHPHARNAGRVLCSKKKKKTGWRYWRWCSKYKIGFKSLLPSQIITCGTRSVTKGSRKRKKFPLLWWPSREMIDDTPSANDERETWRHRQHWRERSGEGRGQRAQEEGRNIFGGRDGIRLGK